MKIRPFKPLLHNQKSLTQTNKMLADKQIDTDTDTEAMNDLALNDAPVAQNE